MTELLSRMPSHDLLKLTVVCVLAVTGVVISLSIVLTIQWRKLRTREWAAGLLQSMLDRGLAPDEIERLLHAAGLGRPTAHRKSPPRGRS